MCTIVKASTRALTYNNTSELLIPPVLSEGPGKLSLDLGPNVDLLSR